MTNALVPDTYRAIDLPAPGIFDFDPDHTSIEAIARHLMITKVRGRFTAFSGEITIDGAPERSSVEVSIEAASIHTKEPNRDAHLRSPDFLDAEQHPTLTYRSTGLTRTGERTFRLDGDLTIRGVTLPVPLEAVFLGIVHDDEGKERIAFSATATLDREAFGMTWNQALEAGGVLVGKKLAVELEIQAVRRD